MGDVDAGTGIDPAADAVTGPATAPVRLEASWKARIGEQLLRPPNPNLVEQIVKTLLQMAVEKLAQVPLGNVAVVGNVLQRELVRITLFHELHGLSHEKAPRRTVFLVRFLLRKPRRAQVLGHGAHALLLICFRERSSHTGYRPSIVHT